MSADTSHLEAPWKEETAGVSISTEACVLMPALAENWERKEAEI